MIFISLAIFIMPVSGAFFMNMPSAVDVKEFNERILLNTDEHKKEVLLNYYTLSGDEYILRKDISKNEEEAIKRIIKETGYNRFFSLFEGSILPNNWLPILFVIAAGLTGYIYSFGFFKLSRFAAHFSVHIQMCISHCFHLLCSFSEKKLRFTKLPVLLLLLPV